MRIPLAVLAVALPACGLAGVPDCSIALDGNDPQRYLCFGGEVRLRYERRGNDDFGTGDGDSDAAYLLQRVALQADLHASAHWRLFAQALSAIQYGDRATASPINQNPIDLQQAFVDYGFGDVAASRGRLTARLGRFGLNLGSGRLVATRAAPNVPYKFDGLQLIASRGREQLQGFLLRPSQESQRQLDGQNDGRSLWASTRPRRPAGRCRRRSICTTSALAMTSAAMSAARPTSSVTASAHGCPVIETPGATTGKPSCKSAASGIRRYGPGRSPAIPATDFAGIPGSRRSASRPTMPAAMHAAPAGVSAVSIRCISGRRISTMRR